MNILATWICLDSKENASYFPSSKGMSSDVEIQNIYWKCLACSMYTARYFNADLRLVVFSNAEVLPIIDGINFRELFKKLNIEFHITPFNFQTPEGYYGNWRNQFYEFSIFEYISNSTFFINTDKFCLIDSDCIITNSLDRMFNQLDSNQFIHYLLDYSESHIINGISRKEMKSIFENLEQNPIDKIPAYYAGEFFATTILGVKQVYDTFKLLWPKLISLHEKKELILNEEAHVLSYIYFKLCQENNIANKFIKRLWTDPTTLRNVQKGDHHLSIWHLPAEKRHGFKELFVFLSKYHFSIKKCDSAKFLGQLESMFTVPKLTTKRKFYYFIKKIAKKIMQK